MPKFYPDISPEGQITSDYGSAPDSCKEECEKLSEGKTINDLNQIADFFHKRADNLRELTNESITFSDFEESKKDKEEGEM